MVKMQLERFLKHLKKPKKSLKNIRKDIEGGTERKSKSSIFIAIAPYPAAYDPTHKYKTTHLIVVSVDMPGMLSDMLSAFEMPNVADAGNDRGVVIR
jgi:prephenate dehydratase